MPSETFRSTFTKVLCVIAWVGLAITLAVVIATPGGLEHPFIIAGLAAVAAIVWGVLWSPSVRADDEAVTIDNVLREIRIPWAALIQIDTKYALTLKTPGRSFSATAAPAPGQLVSLRGSRAMRGRDTKAGDLVRPGDLPNSDSGRAAAMVRERWDRLRESGAFEVGVADTTSVRIRPRVAVIATLAASLVVLLLAALLR